MTAKKKQAQDSGLEHPDYEKLNSIDEIDNMIQTHKDILVRKDKIELKIKDSKKEANAAHNEQLKELLEERTHEVGVIDALVDRKKVLLAQSGVVPMPKKASI
jgi:hypothetical protein